MEDIDFEELARQLSQNETKEKITNGFLASYTAGRITGRIEILAKLLRFVTVESGNIDKLKKQWSDNHGNTNRTA